MSSFLTANHTLFHLGNCTDGQEYFTCLDNQTFAINCTNATVFARCNNFRLDKFLSCSKHIHPKLFYKKYWKCSRDTYTYFFNENTTSRAGIYYVGINLNNETQEWTDMPPTTVPPTTPTTKAPTTATTRSYNTKRCYWWMSCYSTKSSTITARTPTTKKKGGGR